jgi:signal transduction histidine kinase
MMDEIAEGDTSTRFRLKSSHLRYLGEVGLFAAVYFGTARLGLLLDAVSGFATTVWPPTGISLVVLTLFGSRMWPGAALGALLVNLTAGAPLPAACGMALGNTLEAVLGTYLLRRFAGGRGCLERVQGVVGFVVLVAGLSTTVSATIGVASGWLGGVIAGGDAGRAWLSWWLGDAMGDLILAPLLLAWLERPRITLSFRRSAEACVLLISLVAISLAVFGSPPASLQAQFPRPYVLFPFLIWAALRFVQHGSVTATFVVTSVAIWRTTAGLGVFTRGAVNERLLLLQAFMAIVAVTMLILAAEISGRKRAQTRVSVNYSVARILADASRIEDAISSILRAICEGLEWDCGNVWIMDADAATLRPAAEWHRPEDRLGAFGAAAPCLTVLPGMGMIGRVRSEGRSIWIPNVAADTDIVPEKCAAELGLRSAMGFPIFIGKEVHGIITFFSRTVREPDETLLQMMSTLGSQIGEFIQRQEAESDLRLAHAELEARIGRRTKQLSDANRALHEEIVERKQAEEALRSLSTRLLQIQDEERQRLARELHDSTAQGLAALAMNLAVARACRGTFDERARRALDECEVLLDRCSREIRSLSYLLHPPLLEEVGLPAALRWCAEGFARQSGIEVEVDLPDDLDRLPTEVENALFRIAQECLSNVQRHSGSPTARIRLIRNAESVALEVRDRGRGMPAGILDRRDAVESLGVGLLGMRERVRQLGGRMQIASSDQGATVQVEIQVGADAS